MNPMAWFVDTDEGRVNLDHVVRTGEIRRDGRCTLFDAEGISLGLALADDITLGVIIPAAAGFFATVVTVVDSDMRPTLEDLYVNRISIVAWHVSPWLHETYRTRPIIAGEATSNQSVLIERPDDWLDDFEEECSYKNIQAARDKILERYQKEWDRRQERRSKAASPG